MHYFILLLIGCIGGTIIGFIGTGSSLIILPTLTILFLHLFPHEIAIKLAIGTCVATISIGAIVGAYSHLSDGHFEKKAFIIALPAVIIGSLLAPNIATKLPSLILHYYVGLLLILLGAYKIIKPAQKDILKPYHPVSLFLMGFLSALVSGIAGVALGILLMPYLFHHIKKRNVIGLNLALAAFYAPLTTIGYLLHPLPAHLHIPQTIGYIYFPAFLILSTTIAIFTYLGTKAAKKISAEWLVRALYIYLLVAGFVVIILG